MAGNRVDGLDLAAVALGCPRVQEHVGPGRRVGGDGAQRAGVQIIVGDDDIAGIGIDCARLQFTAPCAESTVEDAHLRDARGGQHHQARADPARFQSS